MIRLCLSALLCLSGFCLPAQPWPELIGSGVDSGLEGSRLKMFVDVAKGHRPMRVIGSSQAAPVDERGWPTTDASTVLFDIRPVPAWAPPIDDPDAFQPDWSGVYKLSFLGQADLRGFDRALIRIENQVFDPETNTTRADVVVEPGAGLFYLEFTNTRRTPESETGTGFTDLRLIRPGYPEDTTQVFTDEYLAALKPFKVIRFMGFSMSNNTNPYFGDEKNAVEWEDRRLPTDATQQRTPQRAAGVAWEYAIDISNLCGKDMWINVPVAATDNYIRGLAALIKERLNPELKIYVEVGNEVWNYGFTQYTYNKMAAAAEVANGEPYLDNPAVTGSAKEEVWARRRQARRLYDAIRIFAEAFGEDQINTRIRGIYAWWTIRPPEYIGVIEWMKMHFGEPNTYFWAIAKTNYYNAHAAAPTLSPEQIVAYMKNDSDRGRTYTSQLKRAADGYGLKLVAYEAGPDNGGGSTANVANRILANRLPEMGELMKYDFTENWLGLGGDLYVFLEVAGAYSRYGCWGQTEDAANLKTWKFKAIYELAGLPWPE